MNVVLSFYTPDDVRGIEIFFENRANCLPLLSFKAYA